MGTLQDADNYLKNFQLHCTKYRLTRFLGLTRERILLMDSPSDLPSKSIYTIEHLKQEAH